MSDMTDPTVLAGIRKLDAKPGDVFVLELPQEYDPPTGEEIERIQTQFRKGVGREDARLVVLPPGSKLTRSRTPPARHLGVMQLSRAILAESLGLPAGARIDAITSEAYFATDTIAIKIEHDALPAVQPGQTIPEVRPVLTAGGVSARVDWNANGVMPGVPPTIRPDVAKLAALLRRVSAEFCRCNADVGIHEDVLKAIVELSGKEPAPLASESGGFFVLGEGVPTVAASQADESIRTFCQRPLADTPPVDLACRHEHIDDYLKTCVDCHASVADIRAASERKVNFREFL